MSAVVYRCYDDAGRLLYVGSTVSFESRWRQHLQSGAIWVLETNEVSGTRYASVEAARAAEIVAIKVEHPRWNVNKRATDHPEGKALSVQAICDNLAALGARRYLRHGNDCHPRNARMTYVARAVA